MEEEQKKKISLPETIVFGLLVISAWLLGLLASVSQGILILGQSMMVLDWMYSAVVFAAVQIWLILKGEIGFSKQISSIAGNLAEFVPFLNILPLNLIGFFVTIYLVNHPKVAAIAQRAAVGYMTAGTGVIAQSLMVAGGAAAPAASKKQSDETPEESKGGLTEEYA